MQKESEWIVYQKGLTKVFIFAKGVKIKSHKLPIYHIWREEGTAHANSIIGVISFNGRWRQFTSKFCENTEWSSSCKRRICDFEDILNVKWRISVRRKK